MSGSMPSDLSPSERAILETVRRAGQATRSEVALRTGLSVAMTARLVTRLEGSRLLREAGRTSTTGPGRQPGLVEICPDTAYVVCADIGTERLHLLVTDLHGRPRLYREVSSQELAYPSQVEIVAALAASLAETVRQAGIPMEAVAAVGLAITGMVDSERGICLLRSNTPGWENFPIQAQLSAALHLPVLVEETARAKSIAELRLGAARGSRHYLYVDAGRSIGASIVIDGQPFQGSHGLAGELGHVTVDPQGLLCRCGNRGCIQATASAHAVVARGRELLRQGVYSALEPLAERLTLADIAAAAAQGDKLALRLLTDAGEGLGEAIGMALNLLGMDLTVIGGVLVHCDPVVLEAASRILQLRALPLLPGERTLVLGALGSDAGALGAALHTLDWLFAAPEKRIIHHPDAKLAGRGAAG